MKFKDKGIRVNGISPSDTATESYRLYFPEYINDAIHPEEVAKFAVYLCSEKAKSITGKIYVLKKDKDSFEAFHY